MTIYALAWTIVEIWFCEVSVTSRRPGGAVLPFHFFSTEHKEKCKCLVVQKQQEKVETTSKGGHEKDTFSVLYENWTGGHIPFQKNNVL